MTQGQCETSEKSPLPPSQAVGSLLPVNSDSIYYCHRRLKLKGGFPFLSDEKTKGEVSKAAQSGSQIPRSAGLHWPSLPSPYHIFREAFPDGPSPSSPPWFPLKALIPYGITCVRICAGVQCLSCQWTRALGGQGRYLFYPGALVPVQSQAH